MDVAPLAPLILMGQVDPAIFRPSTGRWAILKSGSSYSSSLGVLWGRGRRRADPLPPIIRNQRHASHSSMTCVYGMRDKLWRIWLDTESNTLPANAR